MTTIWFLPEVSYVALGNTPWAAQVERGARDIAVLRDESNGTGHVPTLSLAQRARSNAPLEVTTSRRCDQAVLLEEILVNRGHTKLYKSNSLSNSEMDVPFLKISKKFASTPVLIENLLETSAHGSARVLAGFRRGTNPTMSPRRSRGSPSSKEQTWYSRPPGAGPTCPARRSDRHLRSLGKGPSIQDGCPGLGRLGCSRSLTIPPKG